MGWWGCLLGYLQGLDPETKNTRKKTFRNGDKIHFEIVVLGHLEVSKFKIFRGPPDPQLFYSPTSWARVRFAHISVSFRVFLVIPLSCLIQIGIKLHSNP